MRIDLTARCDGKFKADLAMEITDEYGRGFDGFTDRDLDRMVFYLNHWGDLRSFYDMKNLREHRNRQIETMCRRLGQSLIEQIEEAEGWNKWLSRIGET